MHFLIDLFDKLMSKLRGQEFTVLTHEEIQDMINEGYLVADRFRVNATSVDLTLHEQVMFESETGEQIDLAAKEVPTMQVEYLGDEGVTLCPGEFMLGSTREMFNLPDNITGVFYMKSSLARSGLDHCNAGFIDPGFNNSRLTLELTNLLTRNDLILKEGMPIGQVKFYRHKKVPEQFSYRNTGQYNGDCKVQGSKGVR